MTRCTLPGWSAPPGVAWRDLVSLRDDDLVALLLPWIQEMQAVARTSGALIAAQVQQPLAEVLASPFGFRACALAAKDGVFAVHHDRRVMVTWPRTLSGDRVVEDSDHGVWDAGRLLTGKYQSFLQDEPLVVFNPNNSARWTPHELLHRVMRFVWAPGLTRWELYVGSRINELAPVVLWYGFDQVLRLRGERFARGAIQAERTPALEDLRWLHGDRAWLEDGLRRDLDLFREGLEHALRELRAVDKELETRACVAVPHPFLDASGDAIAYVVGHHRRLRAPALHRFYEGALVAGRDLDATAAAARERVEETLNALLMEAFEVDLPLAHARASGRRVWDLVQRALLAHPMPRQPLLRDVGALGAALTYAWAGKVLAYGPWEEAVAASLPKDLVAEVLATGALEPSLARPPQRVEQMALPLSGPADPLPMLPAVLRQLEEGLASCVPVTASVLATRGILDDLLTDLLSNPAVTDADRDAGPVWRRAALGRRVEAWIVERPGQEDIAALVGWELALLEQDKRDDRVERLGAPLEELPDEFADEVVVPSMAFRVYRADFDVVAWHASLAEDPSALPPLRAARAYLLGTVGDERAVVPLPAALEEAWWTLHEAGAMPAVAWLDHLARALETKPCHQGLPENADEWLCELVLAGAIGVML